MRRDPAAGGQSERRRRAAARAQALGIESRVGEETPEAAGDDWQVTTADNDTTPHTHKVCLSSRTLSPQLPECVSARVLRVPASYHPPGCHNSAQHKLSILIILLLLRQPASFASRRHPAVVSLVQYERSDERPHDCGIGLNDELRCTRSDLAPTRRSMGSIGGVAVKAFGTETAQDDRRVDITVDEAERPS